MKKNAIVILAPGFEEIEALTPIDLLRRADINVTIAGLGSLEITGARGITVSCDRIVSEMIHHPFDAVILPGGMPGTVNLLESDQVLEIINYAHRDNKVIASICAAALVLDRAGVLNDKEYTCYPETDKKIAHGNFTDKKIVSDGNVITARALSDAIDFSLAVISQLTSDTVCKTVKKQIVY